MCDDCGPEHWKIKKVIAKTGLSKTEIYRRMREPGPNPFPHQHRFSGCRQAVYWARGEVWAWMRREAGLDPIIPAEPTLSELIG